MADTFVKIASVTVGSGGASSIDFTSIPSTYTDLVVKLSTRSDRASQYISDLTVRFNGSSSGYSYRGLYGTGSSASSYSGSSAAQGYAGVTDAAAATSNTFGNAEIYIPNYAGSNQKSFSADAVQEDNQSAARIDLNADLWTGTAAINQVTIYPHAGTNFVQYSTAVLYGIKNS